MSEYKGVLVFGEANSEQLTPLTTELLGAGSRLVEGLGGELSIVLVGQGISHLAQEAIAFGAQKVYLVEDTSLKEYASESYLIALEKVVRQALPQVVLLGQTAVGRDLAPRLAFHLDSAATMDCLTLDIDAVTHRMLMTRPVYGGNALAVQVCETDPQIATVRSKAMIPMTKNISRRGVVINFLAGINPAASKTRVIERKIQDSAGIKLEDARVVVAGGRGIGSLEGFHRLEEIAGLLKGAIGATRPACDNKWIADTQQIGLTGKVVSPDLYIAVGISGASQHISGFSSAKVVVAINKDPESNIFKIANYGIIADWKSVLPALATKLKEAAG